MAKTRVKDIDPLETQDWLTSMEEVFQRQGPARAQFLLGRLVKWGKINRVVLPFTANTPYVNTIPVETVVWRAFSDSGISRTRMFRYHTSLP